MALPQIDYGNPLGSALEAYKAGLALGMQQRKQAALQQAAGILSESGGNALAVPPGNALSGDLGSRIRVVESSGRVNARNPKSSALGPDQFINSTWLDVLRRHRPDLAAGKSDAELLALRTDEGLSGQMRDALMLENQNALRSRGLPVTDGTSYLAHFAGAGGATNVLRADPSTPVSQVLTPAAVAANPFLRNMNAGDLRAWADRKMGGGAPAGGHMSMQRSAMMGDNVLRAANALLGSGELETGMALRDKYAAQFKPVEVGNALVQQQPDGSFKTVYDGTVGKEDEQSLGVPLMRQNPQTGELQIGQLRKKGGPKWHEDQGVILPGFEKVDTETEVQLRNKRTGEVIATVPKDNAGKAADTARGKGAGEAQLALPAAETSVAAAKETLKELRSHPGAEIGTGLSSMLDPRAWTPGAKGYDFIVLNKQAQAEKLMLAREGLKGAGQVTDFEGKSGGDAIANLENAQSLPQYLKVLDRVERMMDASLADMRKKAAMAGKPAAGSATSAIQAPPKPAGMTDAQIIEEARKAVSGGKPVEDVRARLRAWGINF